MSLLAWIEEHHPHAFATLRSPASDDAIAEQQLPDALAAIYREHDGQEQGRMSGAFFADAFHWLPIAEGVASRKMSTDVLEEVQKEFPEQEPFSPSWFPFAADDLGNYLVVDVDADEVFEHLHDEGRIVPSEPESSAEFLAQYLADLRSGELVIDEKLGVVSRVRPEPKAAREYVPSARGKWIGGVAVALWLLGFVVFVIWLETS